MKRKVVHIITKLELGGAQEATLRTVAGLPRDRFEVGLITGEEGLMSAEARAMTDVEFVEVPDMVRQLDPVRDIKALYGIYRVLRRMVKESPGGVIVHTHSSKAGILGRWAAYFAGVKTIVHSIHGYGFNDFQNPVKRLAFVAAEKLTAKVTDGFTADSQHNLDRGRPMGFFDNALAEVVRCAIPVSYFAERPQGIKKSVFGVPDDAPLAVMVSCLKPQKSPEDFARVAAGVLKEVPDAHFVHAGDGELRDSVMAEAERLGISGRFHMLGWRRDVREIIHACDVMVLTSLWEGLPRVLPQAMAAGKPIVATAVDGTPEAVHDGVNGFLARPHDVALMTEKTALLLKDRKLAEKMGEAGRGMVGEFDESEMLRRVEGLYDALLGGKA